MTLLKNLKPGAPIKIAFILIDGFSLLPFIAAMEPLRMSNRLSGEELFEWGLFSERGAAVMAGNGIELKVDGSVRALHDFPNIFVTGGFEPRVKTPRWLSALLKEKAKTGAALGAIGTGTYHLARAGLLDHQRATVHWEYASSFAEEFPLIHVTNSLYEVSDSRMTCSGGIAAMDMMTHLISIHVSPLLATLVADTFIHGKVRTSRETQKALLPIDVGNVPLALKAALSIMQRRNDSRVNVDEIASEIGVSARHLGRLFQKHLGESPLKFANRLRMQRAQSLVRHSNLGFEELAEMTGFTSSAAFSRAYRNFFGSNPSSQRFEATRS